MYPENNNDYARKSLDGIKKTNPSPELIPVGSVNADPYLEMANTLRSIADYTHDGLVNGVVLIADRTKILFSERISDLEKQIKETVYDIECMSARNKERHNEIEFILHQIERLNKIQ